MVDDSGWSRVASVRGLWVQNAPPYALYQDTTATAPPAPRPLQAVFDTALAIYWANEQPKVEPLITKLLAQLHESDPYLDEHLLETERAHG